MHYDCCAGCFLLQNPISGCPLIPLLTPGHLTTLADTDSVVERCACQPPPGRFHSKHQLCVQQLFSHLYCHARRRRLLLPLSAAAKNRQALSVCLNPSRKKKKARGFRQLRALLLQFAQIVSLCRRLASSSSSHEKPDAENRVFKRLSGGSSLSWCL